MPRLEEQETPENETTVHSFTHTRSAVRRLDGCFKYCSTGAAGGKGKSPALIQKKSRERKRSRSHKASDNILLNIEHRFASSFIILKYSDVSSSEAEQSDDLTLTGSFLPTHNFIAVLHYEQPLPHHGCNTKASG
jgi:hypothetical protein